MKSGFVAIFWLAIAVIAAPANAHKPSDSYLKIRGGEEKLSIQWDISIKDLEILIGIDDNQNGEVTWGEIKQKGYAIAAHAVSRLSVRADGELCQMSASNLLFNRHSDGGYVVLVLDTDRPGDAKNIEIRYDLLFDIDPTHRGLVLYQNRGLSSTHVLSPDRRYLSFETGELGLFQALVAYTREGIWHIWIGFDHVLFLVTLLLPAVLVWRGKQWRSVDSFGIACRQVLKIVTVFTVAHSITLWIAVMEYVVLPSQWVEATIAFSIIVTAINTLYPVLRVPGWSIAFVFGLVHGFGFASVLMDLGLSSTTLAVSLLGFNVGVELGQLAIVMVVLPIAYRFRQTRFYRHYVLRFGSIAIAIIASVWMCERMFNVRIWSS